LSVSLNIANLIDSLGRGALTFIQTSRFEVEQYSNYVKNYRYMYYAIILSNWTYSASSLLSENSITWIRNIVRKAICISSGEFLQKSPAFWTAIHCQQLQIRREWEGCYEVVQHRCIAELLENPVPPPLGLEPCPTSPYGHRETPHNTTRREVTTLHPTNIHSNTFNIRIISISNIYKILWRRTFESSVYVRYIRYFALFNVCSSSKNCPSARCASSATVAGRDVFGIKTVFLDHVLYCFSLLLTYSLYPVLVFIYLYRPAVAVAIIFIEFVFLPKWHKLPCFVFCLCLCARMCGFVCFHFCSNLFCNSPSRYWIHINKKTE
jgi:hypothetical protein